MVVVVTMVAVRSCSHLYNIVAALLLLAAESAHNYTEVSINVVC